MPKANVLPNVHFPSFAMNALLRMMLIALLACAAAASHLRAADASSAKGVTGVWHGALIGNWVGNPPWPVTHLRLILKIQEDPEDRYSGVLDSPDERWLGLPLTDITLKDNQFRFILNVGYKPVFEGGYDPDKKEISGVWNDRGKGTPVLFRRKAVIRRPQEPVKPYPYIEEEIAYENKKAKARLAGALTFPRTGGPFPAVLLITGKGPQDRDQTFASHKPFLVIADYLTRRGIAVLRVDDRGMGDSTGSLENATTADLSEDARAGMAFLRSRKEIDPGQIGFIGHSEGATIATMVAARSQDVAFIVMLAGMGVTGDEALILQHKAKSEAMGVSKEKSEKERALNKKVMAIARQAIDPAAAKKKILRVYAEEHAKIPKLLRVFMGNLDAHAEAQANMMTSPGWRYILRFDPKPFLMQGRCPILALNGDKDLQSLSENLFAVERALKAGGNKDYTIKELPGLNHFFQSCKTGLESEYAKIEETFAPNALEIIGDWILKRTTR